MNKEINKIISWIEMSYTRLNYKEELLLVNYIKQLQQENQKYKEVINKAIDYVETHKRKDEFLELNQWGTRKLLDILKEVE